MPSYSIVAAYGVGTTPGSTWSAQNLTNVTGIQVFNFFRELYVTLTTAQLAEPIHINLLELQHDLGTRPELLSVLFDQWGDTAFNTLPSIPQFESVRAVFSDAFRAGYTINTALSGSHYTSASPEATREEVQISRKGTDMAFFTRHCLTTVNGYFYKNETDAAGKITYVPHAGKSLFRSRQNQLGFLSFEAIGEIKQYPITPAMVRPATGVTGLRYRAHIDLPNVDLTNKTVLLVLAGHLQFLQDGLFWPIADNTFCLNMEVVPSLDRFYESRNRLDYTSMGLTAWADKDAISLEDFYSDTAMMGYIAHEQSFFVVVDTPFITRQRAHLKNFKMPGIFIAYKEPKELLVTATGRAAEYWKVLDDGEWLVSVQDSYRANRVFGTTPTENPNAMVSSNNVPYRTYFNSRAHLLDIIADKPIA